MADIHLERAHTLGLTQARKTAFQWAEKVEEKFDMSCSYQEGDVSDELTFTRTGVSGTLKVTKDKFEIDAKLGFLFGAFKDKIEEEIVKNLDALIKQKAPSKKTSQ